MINRKTKIINFFEGIVGDEASLSYLLTHYKPIIDKLRTGHAELALKKHCDYPIYGIRADECNRGNRVLFIMLERNGASYLYFLGEIENHDYRKSPFFQPGKLSKFLEKNNLINNQVLNIDYTRLSEDNFFEYESNVDESDAHSAAIKTMNFYNQDFVELSIYNDHFISLNEEQEEAINIGFTSVITGGPGSGKSFIASEILKKLSSDEKNKVVYLTHSLPLTLFMERTFKQQIDSTQVKGKIFFKTYDSLAKEFAAEKKRVVVGKIELLNWLNNYLQSKSKNQKHLFDLEIIYQEFRIISQYYVKENNSNPDNKLYLKLSQRGSLFLETEQKQWAWELYDTYQEHLEKNKQIHFDFCILTFAHTYSHAILDEAQDYLPAQIRSIVNLTKGKMICLGDSHQNLFDSKSSLNLKFIRSYFKEMGLNIPHHKLKITHRVPQKIATFVNALCQLNYALEEGNVNNDEGSFIKSSRLDHDGNIEFLSPNYSNFSKEAQGETIVITHTENIEKAMARYQTKLVFDINNIKGLEFPKIIIDILDDHQYTEINKILPTMNLDKYVYQEKINRPKSVSKNEKYGIILKRFFVAASRATNQLIIVIDKEKLPHLFKFLNEASSPQAVEEKSNTKESFSLPPTDWHSISEKLLIAGHVQQAQAIFLDKNKLNKTIEQFNTFKDQIVGISPQEFSQNKIIPKQPSISVNTKSTPSKSQQITNHEDKIKKRKKYLSILSTSINEANLKNLFEDSRFEELMFNFVFENQKENTKLENFDVLFIIIIKDEKLTKQLCDFLNKNPEYKKKFTDKIMFNPFRFTYDLKNYFKNRISPLFFIAKSQKNGKVFFKTLLTENKEFALKINGNILCSHDNDQKVTSCSILQILLLSEQGHDILKILFEWNINLKSQIPLDSLCSVVRYEGESNNIFPFSCLTITEEFCEILYYIILANPEYKISEEILHRIFALKEGIFKDGSTFFYLAKHLSGRKILNHLIKNYPEIIKHLSEEALFLGQIGIFDSALYWLSIDDLGLNILEAIKKENPSLIQSPYFIEALCRRINDAKNPIRHNSSPFFMLSMRKRGREILYFFLEKKKMHLHTIAKVLFFIRDSINDTPFYWLTMDDVGINILILLLNMDKQLVISNYFSITLFLKIDNKEDDIHHQKSPLFWLAKFSSGLEFLLNLIEHNEEVMANINNPVIGEYIGDSLMFRKDYKDFSLFIRLVGSGDKGILLLETLIKKIPHLRITAKPICDPCTGDLHDDCSILSLLATYYSNHSFLFFLLTRYPDIASGITLEALCRTYSIKAQPDGREFSKFTPEEKRNSPRYCRLPLLRIVSTPDGKKSLNILFEKSKDLLKQIIDILSNILDDPLKRSPQILTRPNIGADIKEILSANIENQSNLVIALFEKYPEITFNIAAEYWHEDVNNYNLKNYGLSDNKKSNPEEKETSIFNKNFSTLFQSNNPKENFTELTSEKKSFS